METINFNSPIDVLLVEDDMDSGVSVKRMLEKRALSVTLVGDAETAMTRFHSGSYDAIVADIRLPGRSGVDLLKDIRSEFPEMPFILLTGFDSLNTAVQAVRFGAQDYILKPLDNIDDLLVPLQKAVREHRMILRSQALERELRRSEARFRAVIENSMDIAYHFNFKTRSLDYLSPSVEHVFGVPVQSLAKLSMTDAVDLLHPHDQMQVLNMFLALADMLVEGKVDAAATKARMEFRIRHADGSYRWLSVSQSVVYGENGKDPVALVGLARDMTADKQVDEREREVQSRMERVSRMEAVSALAGGVAHDLNNSLSSLLIVPGLVREELDRMGVLASTPSIGNDLDAMFHAASRAGEVVQDLLTLSRRGSQRFEPVSVNGIVREVFSGGDWTSRLKSAGVGVAVEVRLDPNLLDVNGSATHLYRVLLNLAANALDAMPRGGKLSVETRNVTLDSERLGFEVVPPGEYAVIELRDTGVGMGEEQLDQLFEPFNSSKQMGSLSGSGLGMAIVHGILKDHRGFIDVASVKDRGSAFTMYFPVSNAAVPTTESEVDVHGTGRILLVEDQPELLAIVSRALKKLGYDVVGMSTPGEAVAAFMRGSGSAKEGRGAGFDLVIMDMIMRGADGLDVYREIVNREPGQRCLIMSGYSESGRVKEAMALGAGAFLQKPFTVTELGLAVKKLMTGSGASDATTAMAAEKMNGSNSR